MPIGTTLDHYCTILKHNGTTLDHYGTILKQTGTTLEHDDKALKYDSVTSDQTLKGQVRGHIIHKGRPAVLNRLRYKENQ